MDNNNNNINNNNYKHQIHCSIYKKCIISLNLIINSLCMRPNQDKSSRVLHKLTVRLLIIKIKVKVKIKTKMKYFLKKVSLNRNDIKVLIINMLCI